MGGFFATASKTDCVFDLFFGTDYHSHLGVHRGGMAAYNEKDGFMREIHNIENSPFRTKFDDVFDVLFGFAQFPGEDLNNSFHSIVLSKGMLRRISPSADGETK